MGSIQLETTTPKVIRLYTTTSVDIGTSAANITTPAFTPLYTGQSTAALVYTNVISAEVYSGDTVNETTDVLINTIEHTRWFGSAAFPTTDLPSKYVFVRWNGTSYEVKGSEALSDCTIVLVTETSS